MMNALNRNNRKFAVLVGLALVCALWAGAQVVRADTAQSPLPPPTGHVNDYANVMDAASKQRLETILENLRRVGQIEAAVVTIDTTGGQDIYDYSLAVARGWGIGPQDAEKAGLLLVVAINDRKYFTQVSRHLEGDLPDGVVGQIQRERLVPRFKEARYGQGILDTMETYVATLAQKRGFSIEGIDQRQAYRGQERTRGGSRSPQLSFPKVCLFLLILLFVVFIFSRGGKGGGGGGSGCLNLFLLGSLLNSGSRSSGWGGGGFGGGGGGGGGGGFGGFGGGGDFGGGGAGGSW